MLTGLANRSLFFERAAQYVRTAATNGYPLVVFLIDLERFKNINDTFGRAAGDTLIILFPQWITRKVGDVNLLARVGADHFAVVLPKVRADGNVAKLIENALNGLLEYPFDVSETLLRIGVKLGVAQFPNDGADAETLLKNAELALDAAKAGGERYSFYATKMTDAVVQTLTLGNQLRQALENDEFVLYY